VANGFMVEMLWNQVVNGENKRQPDVSEETGLLDSIKKQILMKEEEL
jgi:hypothetical protein